jgi:hypothetical protein
LKTIRPPITLEIIDDTTLNAECPELDKLNPPKDGDLFQVFYVVQDGRAVLASVGLMPLPFMSCPECHSVHVTQEGDRYHCHDCGRNFIWHSYTEVVS